MTAPTPKGVGSSSRPPQESHAPTPPARPTASQRRVLRALVRGYTILHKPAPSQAFELIAPDGYVDGTLYEKTVASLQRNGWIGLGKELTDAGRVALEEAGR